MRHLVFTTVPRYTARCCRGALCKRSRRPGIFACFGRWHESDREEERVSSVVKKRRKKMRKHKHRKMLKKTRWQRKHKG